MCLIVEIICITSRDRVWVPVTGEFNVARVLKAKLGRAVPSLNAAECVIGLTEGVLTYPNRAHHPAATLC